MRDDEGIYADGLNQLEVVEQRPGSVEVCANFGGKGDQPVVAQRKLYFNEAVMLLEMIPDMPECTADFLEWRPLSYREHFAASNFKARDLAIAAYDSSDKAVRAEFDTITDTMTSILTAIGNAMRDVRQDKTRIALARQATGWVKPLIAQAGGIIHGSNTEVDVDTIMQEHLP